MRINETARWRSAAEGVVAVLLLGTLAAGCGGGTSTPSAAQIVSQSAARTATVKSFHVVVSVEHVPTPAKGMSVMFLEGDLAVPDRLHAHISGTLQGIPLTSELIVVGTKHFLKDPFTGAWHAVELGTSPVAFFDPAKGVLAVIKGATDAATSGSEDVGGTATYHLTAKARADALTALLGTPASSKLLPIELWVGKSDMLLRRIRLTGPLAPTEGRTAVRTVELSAFGESVRIVAPALH